MSDTTANQPLPPPDPSTAVVPPEQAPGGLPEAPDDFDQKLLAQFPRRFQTTAAPLEGEVPTQVTPDALAGQTPWPGGTSVDATQTPNFEAMAQALAREMAGKDDEPEVEPVEDPASAAAPPPPDQAPPGGDVSDGGGSGGAAPGGYTWEYVDPQTNQPAQVSYDDQHVQAALAFYDWGNSLPPEFSDTVGALAAGQAVAIPRADYEQYHAWLVAQQAPKLPDLSQSDLDDDARRTIQLLSDEVAQLRAQQQYPSAPTSPYPQQQQQGYANLQANLEAFSNAFYQGAEEYAQARGLTPAEKDALVDQAIKSQIVGHFQRQHTQMNPVTNQVLRVADPRLVAFESLDFALQRNPQIYEAVAARYNANQTASQQQHQQQYQPHVAAPAYAPQPIPTGIPTAATATPANVTPIMAKRARAASLATAPSGSVTHGPTPVTEMSQADIVSGMANMIAAAQGRGG